MNATAATASSCRIAALCGGMGGTKLAFGLQKLTGGEGVTVIVNTGDDFEHLGLTICPDIDTVLYNLSGVGDRDRGWGRANETWSFMAALTALGGDGWFQLGDRDLATHILRSEALRAGETLSAVTAYLGAALGVGATVVPMSDEAVRTVVHTDEGVLPFQRYFVERRTEPVVRGIRFDGADSATPAAGASAALARRQLEAVLICPSNPYLSIDPILSMPGMQDLVGNTTAPVVAVSPVIGGTAVKGPTARIMADLGVGVSNASIAAHYRGMLDGIVIDRQDEVERDALESSGIAVLVTDTLMKDDDDKARLAGETLAFAAGIAARRGAVAK